MDESRFLLILLGWFLMMIVFALMETYTGFIGALAFSIGCLAIFLESVVQAALRRGSRRP